MPPLSSPRSACPASLDCHLCSKPIAGGRPEDRCSCLATV
jgi:hypothetical protein